MEGVLTMAIKRIKINKGVTLYPRDSNSKPYIVRKMYQTLAIPTTAPDGKKAWSIKKGKNEFWYVYFEDINEEETEKPKWA